MSVLRRSLRWAIRGAAVAGVLVLLAVGAGMAVYSPRYVLRTIAWGDSDVGDIYRFPSRQLRASPHPAFFKVASDTAPARAALQAAIGPGDLDGLLTQTGTQALLVLRDDTLLYEGYFNGAARDTLVTSFSVVKSVDSALVGIALAEGKLHSLDDPVTRYLPELAQRDPRFERITLRHLLTMASGIHYVEYPFFTSDGAKTYYDPHLRALALDHVRIVGPPGETWLYNNYHPLLMGMILERATGMSVTRYLDEKLWGRLGMEYDGSFSLDSEESGFDKMESGLNARAIDFAKFGKLFLDGGRWNGAQVVPAAWVTESTTTDPGLGRPGYYPPEPSFGPTATGERGYYAYWWWGRREAEGGVTYAAIGNHGQFIFISPADRVVIVRNASTFGRPPGVWVGWFRKAARALRSPARPS